MISIRILRLVTSSIRLSSFNKVSTCSVSSHSSSASMTRKHLKSWLNQDCFCKGCNNNLSNCFSRNFTNQRPSSSAAAIACPRLHPFMSCLAMVGKTVSHGFRSARPRLKKNEARSRPSCRVSLLQSRYQGFTNTALPHKSEDPLTQWVHCPSVYSPRSSICVPGRHLGRPPSADLSRMLPRAETLG